MFYEGKSKRLPAFSEYVAAAAAHSPKPKTGPLWGILGVVAAAGIFIGLQALTKSTGIAFVLTLLGGIPALTAVFSALDKLITEPRTDADRRRALVHETAQIFHQSSIRKKLHKELDPVAGQLLEACATNHARIVHSLNGPFWADAQTGSHWRAVAEQSLAAANTAMEEAMLLSAACIGKPIKSRQRDLKEAVEDFFELDFEDALKNLRGVAFVDSDSYAFRSPNLPVVFEPVRDIAHRMQALADEVERLSQQAAKDTVSSTYSATASIDLVLKEIQAVETAESELNQQQQSL